jgi:hypothetical protein
LPRRAYENFLLDVDAITAVLNETETFTVNPVDPGLVQGWLDQHANARKYFSRDRPVQINNPEWAIRVDAPKLLENLFADLSESQEIYRKTTHSVRLTE